MIGTDRYDLKPAYIRDFEYLKKIGFHKDYIKRWVKRFKKKESEYKRNNTKPSRVKVIVYNDLEHYEFNGYKECAKYFNVWVESVGNAIHNHRKFKRKYTIISQTAV